ncbi:hypothetical protein ACMXKO_15550 (plasmid) [Clostridium tyrobutyricum]|uniref:hypothetical protein n=1 Tax=Clostridium tyrobutyricum TaxID=1519 RepID=UPI0039F6C854
MLKNIGGILLVIGTIGFWITFNMRIDRLGLIDELKEEGLYDRKYKKSIKKRIRQEFKKDKMIYFMYFLKLPFQSTIDLIKLYRGVFGEEKLFNLLEEIKSESEK